MTTKSTLARNTSCAATVNSLNDGSTYATGSLNIYNASSVQMARLQLSNPAFMTPVDGTAIAYAISDATCTIDSTASFFQYHNRDNVYIFGGAISKNNGIGEMKLPVVVLAQGATISIESASYVEP